MTHTKQAFAYDNTLERFIDMWLAMRDTQPLVDVLWLMFTHCPDITKESLFAEMERLYTAKPNVNS